jgi:hypothetical protein
LDVHISEVPVAAQHREFLEKFPQGRGNSSSLGESYIWRSDPSRWKSSVIQVIKITIIIVVYIVIIIIYDEDMSCLWMRASKSVYKGAGPWTALFCPPPGRSWFCSQVQQDVSDLISTWWIPFVFCKSTGRPKIIDT